MSKCIVEVYPIHFIHHKEDVEVMLKKLNVKKAMELEDFQIFKYLDKMSDENYEVCESVHDAKFVNTPCLGDAYFYDEDEDNLTYISSNEVQEDLADDTYFFLLSINHKLGYYGISAARVSRSED